jgi:hypothetical protein
VAAAGGGKVAERSRFRFDETKPIWWSVIGEDGSTALRACSSGGLQVVEEIGTILAFSWHKRRGAAASYTSECNASSGSVRTAG